MKVKYENIIEVNNELKVHVDDQQVDMKHLAVEVKLVVTIFL